MVGTKVKRFKLIPIWNGITLSKSDFLSTLIRPFGLFFFSLYIVILNLPFYIRRPALFRFNLFLWVHYTTQYSTARHKFEKSRISKDPIELTYGEIPYSSLDTAFKIIKPTPGMTFYDLGSGHGKTLMFSHLFYQLNCIGIELIPTYVKTFNQFFKKNNLVPIPVIHDDLFSVDFSDADIIFLAWTCMGERSSRQIIEKLNHLKSGSFVLTTSAPIFSQEFTLVKELIVPFSWGFGHLYIQKKC